MKTLLGILALAFLLSLATACMASPPVPHPDRPPTGVNGPMCGGLAGTQCPNGYTCVFPNPAGPDQVGACRKIDQEKLAACIKTRNITVTCSTTYQCAKEKELLGPVFQSLTVKYDDALTDCSKYGDKCETEYQDKEMVMWSNPGRDQSLQGAMTMERLGYLFDCEQ